MSLLCMFMMSLLLSGTVIGESDSVEENTPPLHSTNGVWLRSGRAPTLIPMQNLPPYKTYLIDITTRIHYRFEDSSEHNRDVFPFWRWKLYRTRLHLESSGCWRTETKTVTRPSSLTKKNPTLSLMSCG